MPVPIPPGVNLSQVAGPMLVGNLLQWMLFGIFYVQAYIYYLAFPKDRSFIKYLVLGIFLLETVQAGLSGANLFFVFASGYGDFAALVGMYYNWLSLPIMTALEALAGQLFFAYRIQVISKSIIIPGVIVLLALLSASAGFATGYYCSIAKNVIDPVYVSNTKIPFSLWCGASALTDIVIAACMTFYLYRNDSGFSRTHAVIAKVMRVTIETGAITAAAATAAFVLFVGVPGTTYYAFPGLLLGKLYANTTLAVLNSRVNITGSREGESGAAVSVELGSTAPTNSYFVRTGGGISSRHDTNGVEITKEVMTDSSQRGRMYDKYQYA